jgi:hypothetical protein
VCKNQVVCKHQVVCKNQLVCRNQVVCKHQVVCKNQLVCRHQVVCRNQVVCKHQVVCKNQLVCRHLALWMVFTRVKLSFHLVGPLDVTNHDAFWMIPFKWARWITDAMNIFKVTTDGPNNGLIRFAGIFKLDLAGRGVRRRNNARHRA